MSYSYTACYCRECLCMDLEDRNPHDRTKAYCSAYRKYYNPNSKACSRYFEYDENRRPSTGCYLTTIICNILGMEDHGESLECLRNFRDNYMLNHPELYPMLIEYDLIGPKIAEHISEDTLVDFLLHNHFILHIFFLLHKKFMKKIMTKQFKNIRIWQIDLEISIM